MKKALSIIWGHPFYLFIGFAILELVSYTFGYDRMPYLNPWILVTAGIMTGVSAYRVSAHPIRYLGSPIPTLLLWSMTAIGSIVVMYLASLIFVKHPSHPNSSDIVPSLELYVKRFLAGEYPYQPMNFGSWTVSPNYFPLRWLPYVWAEWLKIDYRWIPFMYLTPMLYLYIIQSRLTRGWYQYLYVVFPFASLILIILRLPHEFAFSSELMVVFFYLLLAWSISTQQYVWISLGVAGCLLSRYSVAFWLPLIMLHVYMNYGIRFATKVSIMILAMILLVLGPYVIYDGGNTLIAGLMYNHQCALGVWQPMSWQSPTDVPHHLNHGVNFSIYIYRLIDTPEHAYQVMTFLYLVCSLVVVMASVWMYLRVVPDRRIALVLVSLKVYLVVFYTLFTGAYAYLYFTPLLLTLYLMYYLVQIHARFNSS